MNKKYYTNIFLKFWFINKNTAKVTLVWNFDLRIFSVYAGNVDYEN